MMGCCQQQPAEAVAPRYKADNDTRHPPRRFDLPPTGRAPSRQIRTSQVLGHDSFLALGDCLLEVSAPAAEDACRKHQARLVERLQKVLQNLPSHGARL